MEKQTELWKLGGMGMPLPLMDKKIDSNLLIAGKWSKELIFYMIPPKGEERSSLHHSFYDFRKTQLINWYLISPKLNDLFSNFKIQGPYTSYNCIVSDGIEEKEYFLYYLKPIKGYLGMEELIDFKKTVFRAVKKERGEIVEKGDRFRINSISDFVQVGKEIQEKIKKEGYTQDLNYLHLEKLAYNKPLDLICPVISMHPLINNKLKNVLIKEGITGFNADYEFKEYIIEMSEEDEVS